MGMSIVGNLAFGIEFQDQDSFYWEFMEDGFLEWLYDNVPKGIDIVTSNTHESPIIILSIKHYCSYFDTTIIPELMVEQEEVDKLVVYTKALCRYLDVEYQEPKWLLSAFYG